MWVNMGPSPVMCHFLVFMVKELWYDSGFWFGSVGDLIVEDWRGEEIY